MHALLRALHSVARGDRRAIDGNSCNFYERNRVATPHVELLTRRKNFVRIVVDAIKVDRQSRFNAESREN